MELIKYIVIFFIVLFTGDGTMLILSSTHYINFFILLFICIISNLTSDILFFILSPLILKKIKFKKFIFYKRKASIFLGRIKKPQKIIFLSKFVYGIRTLSVILLSSFKLISIKKFIIYDFFAIGIINGVVLIVGWIYGSLIGNIFQGSLFLFCTSIFIFIIIISLTRKWIEKRFVQSFLRTKKRKG
jgi:membrane protein DedA with SNARE-associated domain